MRKITLITLSLGLFYTTICPALTKASKDLEQDIEKDYKAFVLLDYKIPELIQQPCKAVQFVNYLQNKLKIAPNEYIAEKISAIILEGAGVGGIDTNRQATEDERRIIFNAIGRIYGQCEIVPEAMGSEKPTSHQQTIKDATFLFGIYKEMSPTFYPSYNINRPEIFFKNFEIILHLKSSLRESAPLNSQSIYNGESIEKEETSFMQSLTKASPPDKEFEKSIFYYEEILPYLIERRIELVKILNNFPELDRKIVLKIIGDLILKCDENVNYNNIKTIIECLKRINDDERFEQITRRTFNIISSTKSVTELTSFLVSLYMEDPDLNAEWINSSLNTIVHNGENQDFNIEKEWRSPIGLLKYLGINPLQYGYTCH